jgi:uncharacterized NAD-dependent epimerase/dehydratase family protein
MKSRIDISGIKGDAFVLSNGILDDGNAKTTHGLIRGSSRFAIKAVIDPVFAGKDAGEILDGKHRGIPVIASLEEAIALKGKPDFCIIGIATEGGVLPENMMEIIKETLNHGISIVNGLHKYMNDQPEMVALAEKNNVQLIDVRRPKTFESLHFWSEEIYEVDCPVIAVMGMDCAIGKRTSARMLMEACRASGLKAEMIYTGQTGWMQGAKYGFIFDSTLNDFVSGELSHAIISAYKNEKPDIIFLEGQSSLRNPSGPCGPEFLISGNAKKVVLVYRVKQQYFNDDPKWGPMPPVESEIKLINAYGAEVIALMLNTRDCTLEEATKAKDDYGKKLGIPVLLPIEEGVEEILPVIIKLTTK